MTDQPDEQVSHGVEPGVDAEPGTDALGAASDQGSVEPEGVDDGAVVTDGGAAGTDGEDVVTDDGAVVTDGEAVDDAFVATVLPGDDPASIATAAEAVAAGSCIVLPTDTVYGIGADPFTASAVQRLQDAKRRGSDTPPPVLIASVLHLETLADRVPQQARDLAEAFWPGPLTLVVTAQRGLRMDLGDAEGTIALRIPAHPVALDILRATGPLAVSSANVHGRAAGTTVDEAVSQLGSSVAVYVDGGPTPGSVPSSIVDLTTTPGRVLRVGVLSVHDLQRIVPELEPPEPAPATEPVATTGDVSPDNESGTVVDGDVSPDAGSEAEPQVAGGVTPDSPESVSGAALTPDDGAEVVPQVAGDVTPDSPETVSAAEGSVESAGSEAEAASITHERQAPSPAPAAPGEDRVGG